VTKLASVTTESSSLAIESQLSLEQLLERYPLPSEWSPPTLYAETVKLGPISLELCGLASQSGEEMVTGSAAELGAAPLVRAYFELIERASLISAGRDVDRELTVKDIRGRTIGCAPCTRVFPRSSDPARRFARSNGVAAGTRWSAACRAARWELLERDRVLRSWYGETRPRILSLPAWPWLQALETYCHWQAYAFAEDSRSDRGTAVGVFAFPRSPAQALSYGFAADASSTGAMAKAAAECLQRLGFLWGEAIPTVEPEFAPTAEYHQEFYLQPGMHHRVRDWLAGSHVETPCRIRERTENPRVPEFVDLTPECLWGKLFVAKALPCREVDLIFGCGHPAVDGPMPLSFQVHPIA
jgi:hypothetical protein